MPAFLRRAQRRSTPEGDHYPGGSGSVQRTAIRVVTALLALTAIFLLTPTIASADDGTAAAAGTTAAAPLFWGLDLAAVLWLLAGLLAVTAGLFAGSRSGGPVGAQAAAGASNTQLSLVAPGVGQTPAGTRQAAGTNDDPNGA